MASMKKIFLLTLLLSTSAFSAEIVCLPLNSNKFFDEVQMKKEGRGNKFSLTVIKKNQEIQTGEVRNSFIRRNRTSIYQNKDRTIIIKTSRLRVNQVQRSSIQMKGLFAGAISGVCKMYSDQ